VRTLSPELEAVQENKWQQRAWKVEIYDIRSTRTNATPDTMSRFVQGLTLDAITGPLDITSLVTTITITERSSDFVQGSVMGNSLTMSISDKNLLYDPQFGSEKRWLRAGNIIQITEGDTSLAESLWVKTFTGRLVGRPGASGRDRADNAILEIAAEDRTSELLKQVITSAPFDQGVSYATMMTSILEDEVGLGASEFVIGGLGAQLTTQATTQIVDESPMTALAKIAFADGAVPYFRGDGVLAFTEATSEKGPAVSYTNEDMFTEFARPFSPLENQNEVIITGLASEMTKIPQPSQVLATANITMGFFGGGSSIKVFWSDDQTQQAENTRLKKISSVTGALIPFGAEEYVPTVDDDGGTRGGRIKVDGAFYAPLITSLHVGRLAASFIPDSWAGVGGGPTIPIGRIVEGIISISVSLIQATIGRGEYEILGDPYEYVFQELEGRARVDNLDIKDIRSLLVENHLIDTQAEVDAIALRELKTVRKRGNLWTSAMRHDLRLEPWDKFVLPDLREFVITEITRTISRVNPQMATLQLFETTFGINP